MFIVALGYIYGISTLSECFVRRVKFQWLSKSRGIKIFLRILSKWSLQQLEMPGGVKSS
jgi:hypothetical protein